jgi:hypothetical protein
MAWADFATLAAGDWITATLAGDLKAAAQERTGWVGEATEHTRADNLDAAQASWTDADFINDLQTICENIASRFKQTSRTGSSYDWWSDAVLKQHLYDSHGGEASGIGYTGGVHNWIRVPTRLGTLSIGKAQAGDWMIWENFKAVYFYLDHLRWILLDRDTSGRIDVYRKRSGDQRSAAAAWSAMKAATPSHYTYDEYNALVGIRWYYQGPTWWSIADERRMIKVKYNYTPSAGHYPTSFDAGKHLVEVDDFAGSGDTVEYKGPWTLMAGCTHSASGAYTTGGEADEFTLSAVNAIEEMDMGTPDSVPKSTPFYAVYYNTTYDDASPPAGSERADLDEYQWIMKPATSYGT